MPMPPCICTVSRLTRFRVSPATALASETAWATSGALLSMAVSAASTQERVSSSSVNILAARCCSAWKLPRVWPNCTRVLR